MGTNEKLLKSPCRVQTATQTAHSVPGTHVGVLCERDIRGDHSARRLSSRAVCSASVSGQQMHLCVTVEHDSHFLAGAPLYRQPGIRCHYLELGLTSDGTRGERRSPTPLPGPLTGRVMDSTRTRSHPVRETRAPG